MKLMTKAILKSIPPLYGQEKVADPIVHVKFFTPDAGWTWYATEFDPKEGRFFGLVTSPMMPEGELGYFMLSELQSVRGPLGLPIERDMYFGKKTLSQVKEQLPGANPEKKPRKKKAAKKKWEIQCQECRKLFKRAIGPKTFEIRCPGCGSYDTMPTEFFGRMNPAFYMTAEKLPGAHKNPSVIQEAIQNTKKYSPGYWKTIVKRPAGSQWNPKLKQKDLIAIFKKGKEIPAMSRPGMIPIARYFEISHRGLGTQDVLIKGVDKIPGAIHIRMGHAGPEFFTFVRKPEIKVNKGILIIGPGEKETEGMTIVWTAYPGMLTARTEPALGEALYAKYGEGGKVPKKEIPKGATIKMLPTTKKESGKNPTARNLRKKPSALDFLIDQLANAMEFYDEKEFVDHIGDQTGIPKTKLKHIFRDYWKISPKDRVSPYFDWHEWIKRFQLEVKPKGVARELPKIRLQGEIWYYDERLQQIRKVDDPHMAIPFAALDGMVERGEIDISDLEFLPNKGKNPRRIKRPAALRGGLAEKGRHYTTDFDPRQLKMGIKVEMEHTKDRKIARMIAMDHLAEIPDYYTRLARMEKAAGVSHNPKKKRIRTVEEIHKTVMRQEYGPCDPAVDDPCILYARLVPNPYYPETAQSIQVYVVGKWRTVRGYFTKKKGIPSKKIQNEAITTIRINTGAKYDRKTKKAIGGTFGNTTIKLKFI